MPALRQVLLGAPRTRREALTPSPVFVAVVVLTAVGGVLAWRQAGSARGVGLGVFLFVVGGWVLSLCLHEFAHALVAYRSGDRDVLSAGYLTLNPLLYGHPFFSVVLPVLLVVAGGIGLPGGAVYLHRHRFRTRGLATAVSLAGPAVNLVLAAVLLLAVAAHPDDAHLAFWSGVAFLGLLQVTAAVLNLLPVPGLDGWGAIEPWVSRPTAEAAARLAPFGMIVVFGVLFVPQFNAAFFDLVDRIYGLTGASSGLAGLGRALFRFWSLTG